MEQKKFRDLLVNKYDDANIVLYGVPFDQNCSVGSGSKSAPTKLRELSWWLPPFSMDGKALDKIRIFDKGDLECGTFQNICDCSDIFRDDKIKVIFGGDHSISIPFQERFIKNSLSKGKTPVLIHIDAHCDICDTYLGNDNSHACTVRRALDHGLKDDNLFMIGIREFEKDGFDYLINRANDVHLFKASDILNNGLSSFFKQVIEKNTDEYRLYISFDIDSLDSSFAPGTGTPETCGLTPPHLKSILSFLGTFSNICCLDLVEVAPPLDVNNITSWCALKLLYEFFASLNI